MILNVRLLLTTKNQSINVFQSKTQTAQFTNIYDDDELFL